MILLHFKVNQTQNILGERQGKIDSNIDEVNIEKILISQATPIHCSKKGRKVQSMIQVLLRAIVNSTNCKIVGCGSIGSYMVSIQKIFF